MQFQIVADGEETGISNFRVGTIKSKFLKELSIKRHVQSGFWSSFRWVGEKSGQHVGDMEEKKITRKSLDNVLLAENDILLPRDLNWKEIKYRQKQLSKGRGGRKAREEEEELESSNQCHDIFKINKIMCDKML